MVKKDKIVIAVVAVFVILSYVAVAWEKHRDKIFFSSESAGIAQTAQFLPAGFLDNTKTQITTDKGTFLADGTFQLIKGDELFIEKRVSGKHYICDHKNSTCNKLD